MHQTGIFACSHLYQPKTNYSTRPSSMQPEFAPNGFSSESSEVPDGLGILSSTPTSRSRSYTLDSFNISSIEKSRSLRRPPVGEQYKEDGNWETATWVFSDILQSISIRDKEDVRLLITKSNQLVNLLKENPSLREEIIIQNVMTKINFMLYHTNSLLRCAAYRVLRHCIAGEDSVLYLVKAKILIFLIITLSTPTPFLEKQEALKLIREFIEIPKGTNYISIGVVKALVALVEHENEDVQPSADQPDLEPHVSSMFVRMCIETVCEISVSKPDIVFHGGGLRLLINLLINGPSDIAASCMVAILTLLDHPNSRLFFRNGFDLDSLISVYSTFEDDDSDKIPNTKKYYNRALKTSFLLSMVLKTWTGMICFSRDKFQVLKELLENLKKRNDKLREIIMDLLMDVLHIRSLPWFENSVFGEFISDFYNIFMNDANIDLNSSNKGYRELPPGKFESSIVSHYQGLLCKVLLNCDLIPLLIDIIDENRNEEISNKACYLLTNVLQLSINLLPKSFYNENVLKAFSKPMSISTMAQIEVATRLQHQGKDGKKASDVKDLMKTINIQSRYIIDDITFKSMISKTKVLVAKEFEEWNWTVISQLFQGPLRNPKRFSELQEKFPKFMKALTLFYRPFKFRFSNLPAHASHKFPKLKFPKKLITVGCQMLESLLTFDEGFRFLLHNKLLPQIAEILAQVDPYSGISAKEAILSKRRLEDSLSVGYIKFIGVFSSNTYGLRIIEHWQMLQLLNNIIEGSSESEESNYLIFSLLSSLDFVKKSPLRLLLSKVFTVANPAVKLFALENVLKKLFLNPECEEMVISNLCTLIYDETETVSKMSVKMLHEYYLVRDNLDRIDVFIGFSPPIEILSNSFEGRLLLFNFCNTSNGFRFLYKNGFIETCFNESVEKLQTLEYLCLIESSLRSHFFPFYELRPQSHSVYEYDLHHFFKYLLATEDGYNFFNSRRHHIDDSIHKMKFICRKLNLLNVEQESLSNDTIDTMMPENAIEDSPSLTLQEEELDHLSYPFQGTDSQVNHQTRESDLLNILELADQEEEEYLLRRLKQYLWIFGEIASANYGIQILDPMHALNPQNEHVVETIHLLFLNSSVWQLRGLAFYQLGKIGSTSEGAEILDDLQWVSLDLLNKGKKVSLAYPNTMENEDIFGVETLNPYQDASYYTLFGGHEAIGKYLRFSLTDEIVFDTYAELDDRILSLINHLSSVLGRVERKATKELNRIKRENPQVFSDINLFLKVIRLVDKGKFKFRTRAILFGLFNTSRILEGLLKRDRKASSNKASK